MNDIDTSDRPKWLLELENRKRKPRLAHEAGAGAPCVICKETCPGLDLHFWRKICKNCKCSKDDHDVEDDDFPQFDLLFGPSKKHKTKPTLLHINGGKEHVEEAFEWIPPDTTKDLAADYMKALPIEKLPIKGSAGAALRRQLLQKQLPLHDIDYKTCDKLSDQEKKEFENYLENIKKYVGQGAVIKILSARPYNGSLLTPVNATDMQQLSLQNKPNAPSKFVQLRTPSSFAPKNSYKKSVHENANMQEFPPSLETLRNCDINVPIVEKYNTIGNNSEIIRSKPIKDGFYNQAIHPNDFKQGHSLPLNTVRNVSTTENPNYLNDITSSQNPSESYKHMLETPSTTLIHSRPIDGNVDAAEAILADALLSSSTTQANDIIGSTLDEKGLMYIREKLTNKYSKQENQMQPPYGVPNLARSLDSNNSLCKNSSLRSQNTDLLTNAGSNTDRTVSTKSSGILTPSQQLNLPISKPISAEVEAIKSNSKTAQFDPLVSAQTLNTQSLRDNISPILLRTADNSAQTLSSQSCLQSCNNDHPAKLNSFTTPSAVIYSQQLQNQIFPHEIVSIAKELEQSYPRGEQLESAIKELTIDANKSQKCHKCEEEIRVGDVAIVAEKAKNTVWHPGCFVCNTCNELLVDLVYFYYKNKLYCGRDLATLLGIPRCFACDELIFVREYTVAEGHNYHVQHFCCWDCDVPLAGKQYITENDRPLCLLCYQKTYAKTCNTCERVIAADQQGVAVKDLNFHAIGNCFCCHVCNKNLLNGKFAVKESRLFCSKECISNFYVSTK